MRKKAVAAASRLETPQDYDHRIAENLKALHKKVVRSHEKQEKLNGSLGALEELMDKSGKNKAKLKAAYTAAIKDSEAEAEVLREALAEIQRIRELKADKRLLVRSLAGVGGTKPAPMRRGALMVALGQAAATLPLWLGSLGEEVPPLVGARPEPPAHVLTKGDAVAALVKGEEDEHNWILAEVKGPAGDAGTKWELEDVDEEQRERYSLPRKKIIPLPTHRANPTTHPYALFPAHVQLFNPTRPSWRTASGLKATVLALYPQTTCFYKGVVEQTPASAAEDYLVAFEDPSYPTGTSPPLPVPQRYVIAYRDFPGARIK